MNHATRRQPIQISGIEATVCENPVIDEKYYEIPHPSGLMLYVIPKKLSTAYALFATRYGSIDYRFRTSSDRAYTEVPDGIAHFLEHKMFEYEDGEDAMIRLARIGANANAYTSFDMTAYLFSCTERFDEALDILLDFVTHPYFPQSSVERERSIIAQEIGMGRDNPYRALTFGMLKAMYEKHKVRLEIAGSVESIAEIDSDMLYRCYHTFYHLNNMALCVCGDVSPEQVIASADRILVSRPPQQIDSVSVSEPEQVFRERFTVHMQVSKPQFQIGIKDTAISPIPEERMKKSAAFSILEKLLFGAASPFYRALYEEGAITGEFGCWSEHNKSFSFMSIGNESDNPEDVYRRFRAYIEQTKKTGLDRDDFERCRRVLYAQLIKSFDSTEDIANNFLEYIFDDCDMLVFADLVNRLTFEETEAIFRELYRDGHYTLAVVYPLTHSEAQ